MILRTEARAFDFRGWAATAAERVPEKWWTFFGVRRLKVGLSAPRSGDGSRERKADFCGRCGNAKARRGGCLAAVEPPRRGQGSGTPDERYAAYVSNESGRFEIYLKHFPSGEGKVQVSWSGGDWPIWSRRGNELFYVEVGRASRSLMVVPVSTRNKFKVGTPHRLFAIPVNVADALCCRTFPYDVSPDGKRFIAVQPVDDQAPRNMVIVQNWFAEFKDK